MIKNKLFLTLKNVISLLTLLFLLNTGYASDVQNQSTTKIDIPKENQATSRTVTTMYGTFVVTEPVLLELFACPAIERLKDIHQYGMRYVIDNIQYTRYDHSVGVWAILRRFNAGLTEQIAGLLHDISHTIFSHVGDFLFYHSSATSSYQDGIYEWFLKRQHIPEILAKYGISLDAILYKEGKALMLEQDLPDICADRLEYNLEAGVIYGFFTQADVENILQNVVFENGKWFFKSLPLAKKFALLTVRQGANPGNFVADSLAAEILQRAVEIGLISLDEVHFSVDTDVLKKLITSDDDIIKETIKYMLECRTSFVVTNDIHDCDEVINLKFRGVNPLVCVDGSLKRLSEYDKEFADEYALVKKSFSQGTPIKFTKPFPKSINKFAHIVS